MKKTKVTQKNTTHRTEAFSRVLIDKALAESGWDLLDAGQQEVLFEHHAPTGRAVPFRFQNAENATKAILEYMTHVLFGPGIRGRW
jgi:hypothetical protein